jgi:hypothetical protein
MPFSPPLVLEVGKGTKFQLLPFFNIVGPFLGLTRNLGARHHETLSIVHLMLNHVYMFIKHSLHGTLYQFNSANFVSNPCCEMHGRFALIILFFLLS